MNRLLKIAALMLLLGASTFAYAKKPPQGVLCEIKGNKQFSVGFTVTGNNAYQKVYFQHNGNHADEVAWYTLDRRSDSRDERYHFNEQRLKAGQVYEIQIFHDAKNNNLSKYYRRVQGQSDWQLIGTMNKYMRNGQLQVHTTGSGISDIYCDSDATEPPIQQCNLLPLEEFNTTKLSNWSVMGYGSSTPPSVNASNKRFVLNANKQRQATASAYNYTFPSDENYLQIEFDHYAYGGGNSGGDGVALVISDANVPPKTGAFGGPLGYGMKLKKNHSDEVAYDVEGFAGGWLAIGIDEYGNFTREGGEKLTKSRLPHSVAVRGAGGQNEKGQWLKGYAWIDSERFSSAIDNRKTTPHRYQITLDSRTAGKIYLSVSRKVGSNGSWLPVIRQFDVMRAGNFNYTPENFRISVTASTGAAKNTHEVDNFQVCAEKFQPITRGIHHFQFDYTGTGSICQASNIVLKACMNEECDQTYPDAILEDNPGADIDPITVTLSPPSSSTHTWLDGDQVTFLNSKALKLQAHQSGYVKLGIAKSNIIQFGFEGAKCKVDGVLSEENCNLLFNANALGVELPNKIAGKPFYDANGKANYEPQRTPYLEFCGSSEQSGQRGEYRNIILSLEPIEPMSNAVSVSGYLSFKNQNGRFMDEVTLTPKTSLTVRNVYFDPQGRAQFNFRYPEAGKAMLRAQIQGEKESLGENSFVSFPAYLTVSSAQGDCGNGSCSTNLVAAQETFNMIVTAHQYDGEPAKNYQQEGLTISHSITYPTADGVALGALANNSYDHTTPKDGSVIVAQKVSEAGEFEFVVTPPELYLGSSDFTIEPAQKVLGRFYPQYFKVYSGKDAQWAYPNNQDFTYMQQPFGASKFYVEALNAEQGTLTNYAFFDKSLLAEFNLRDRSSHHSRFYANKSYQGVWKNADGSALVASRSVGEYTGNSGDGLEMGKGSGNDYPDGPFNFNQIGQDTLVSISASSGVAPGLVIETESTLRPQPDIRFGRIDLDDVGEMQGENTVLHIPLRVEYWNGSRFTLNLDDSQTTVMGAKANQAPIWPTDASKHVNVLLSEGGKVQSGRSRLIEAQEAASNRQQTRIWLELDGTTNALPWLKYNWDKGQAGEENPASVVTFGVHRGNDRVIFRGEPGLTNQ